MKNEKSDVAGRGVPSAVASVDPEELIGGDKAAKLLGISPTTLVDWRYQGRGPCFLKVGRLVWYRRDDLSAWLAAQRRDPAAAAA